MQKAFAALAALLLVAASAAATIPKYVPVEGPKVDFYIENRNLVIYCNDCTESDRPVVYASFALQNKAYECLAQYFQYRLGFNYDDADPNLVYEFSHMPNPVEERYARVSGKVHGLTITSKGFFGTVWQGSDHVNRVEDVRLDLHETTHAFIHSVLKPPQWFDEGIAIMLAQRLSCDPKQAFESRFSQAQFEWRSLKNGLPINNPLSDPHVKGAIFIAALNDDYACSLYCIRDIFNRLQQQPGMQVSTKDVRKAVEWRLGYWYSKESIDYLFKTLDLD